VPEIREVASGLWIGGAPASGKTTIALRLARRHGLRWYGADTRTWAHRDRALAAGVEAARRWESLAPEERGAAPADELVAMSLHRERGRMVIDDVRALPDTPLPIAEGSTVPASVVSSGITDAARSVWLIPTPDFLQAQLASHPAEARKLYIALRDVIAEEAKEHHAPTVSVDGQLGVDEMTELVEERFADAIREGPRTETVVERRRLLRQANLSVTEQVRGFYRRPWAAGDPETIVRSFICECGDATCEASVEATVRDAEARPVVARGHR
jgi:predicted kinase